MDSATSKMVAEAALSALFQRLLDTLAPPFLKRLGFLFGVEKEAKKLKSTLLRIEALLSDAEERQIKEKSVRLWLSDLKHVAYDAEDILDELAYSALQSKIEAAPIQTRKRKLIDQVPHFFSQLGSNFNFGSRIKEIRERLDEIVTENNHLHLRVIHHGPETERLRMPPPTSSFVDESIVFGREADKSEVVRRLLTSDDSSIHQVVPICGMGGLGKTTLAQLAYNDEHVVKHFEVRSWVYVSQDFDLIKLSNAIVESVTRRKSDLTNLDAIQVSIKEALKEKRFLLVLDDVWTEDFDDWHKLRAPLMFGARGSRILVTTRSRKVSSNMGTVPTHFLQGLSEDECWILFKSRAFVDAESDAHPDFVKIGKKIVNKCKGLPLAVKTLGGLLRSKVDVVEWEAILKSEVWPVWDLPEEKNDILPALRLSYHHLPAHLKRCFAYCGCVVDKGLSGVKGNELILKWMAQGFIQPSEQMEDIGREYLADLVSRSLLNCQERRKSFYYTMHDLTHDLARSVLGTDFWKIGDEKSHGNNAEKTRYMSDCHITSWNFEDFYCLKNLRTLSVSWFDTGNIPADLFINLRHIRTLQLYVEEITELPESIGDLLQLRYLYLSGTDIERLPKSTARLYNLQTLILEGCSKLVEVPESIGDLLQLRYLDLSYTDIVRLPKSTTRLYNLQTLILKGCTKLVEVPESVGDLLQLRYLALSYTDIVRLPKSTTRLYNLQTLILKGCTKLVEVPESVGDLLQLRYLALSLCTNIVRLPKSTTRLYNLQTLILKNCWHLVELPRDLSNLVNLRHLRLDNLGHLDNLRHLRLDNSSSISTPPRIGTLKNLQMFGYFNVVKEIGRGINELKDLIPIHLTGRLCISKLENVVNVEEAKEAQLKNKQKTDELELRWKCDDVKLRHEGIEEEVLNALQPHTNLKELQIEGYCGVRFPTWLGDSSFSKLISVSLRKCRCPLLPPFGQLPSLKHLRLAHLHELKKVGREFYGDGSGTMTGFPPLESLDILSMPDLEELSGLESDIRHIRGITILNCTKLKCLPRVSAIRKFTLYACDGQILSSLWYLTSLSYLEIWRCSNITSLGNGLRHLTSLQSLDIFLCPELTSLTDVDLPATLDDGLGNSNYSNPPTCLPKGLKKLTISGCPKIHSLPEELLTTLRSLEVRNCPLLVEKYLVLAEGGNGYRCKISDIPDITFIGWLRDPADRSLFLKK